MNAASKAPRIRIFILEDNEIVAERFHRIFSAWDKGEVVGCHYSLMTALEALNTTPVDLLVADIHLEDGSGLRAIEAMSTSWPNGHSIVISALADRMIVIDALKAGATGYILKDDDSISIIEAVEAVLAGQSPISISIARHLVDLIKAGPVKTNSTPAAMGVTEREVEILNAISKGFTNREIAEIMCISAQTVPVHIRNIYRKLHASNRSEATFEARRLGLI